MNQNYVSAISIHNQDCEYARIEFVATRINMRCLGQETGFHGNGTTLPRCTSFNTNNVKRAEAMELNCSILNFIAKHG